MLRIGDFARLAGLSVRALRHYEAEGLLTPARVDERTGYRFYAYDQLAAIDQVLALRDLGFGLADIRALLSSRGDVQALGARLRRQRERLAAELARQAARLRKLDALQRAVAADPDAPELSVRVRPLPDVRVLSLRARVSSGGIAALFEEVEARAARDRLDASPFLIFHSAREVEACVPVRGSSPDARLVEGAALAGSITYRGAYERTAPLRARMMLWLRRSGLRPAGPLREVYHRFGADQRGYTLPARRLATCPDEFVTELQVPAEEAR